MGRIVRILSLISLLLIVSISIFVNNERYTQSKPGLYVSTQETPIEVIEHAIKQFNKRINYYLTTNEFDTSIRYSLGTPLAINEYGNSSGKIYKFPIIYNTDEILAMLIVYDDGSEYSVQIGPSMTAVKLEELKGMSSFQNPITFFSDESGFYAFLGNHIEKIGFDDEISFKAKINSKLYAFVKNSKNTVDMLQIIYTKNADESMNKPSK